MLQEELVGPEGRRHFERTQKAVLCELYCCVTGQVVLGVFIAGSAFILRVKQCFVLDCVTLEMKEL